ncbi:MAG: DJ-1/PfpI family protein, partial [Lachnospiraceae bacterium]|nr:DJ-1/PfpI family protein [Lachnospiraceae bacterium]
MQIGVFFGERFEEVEAITPVDLLKRAGHNVLTVSVGHSHHVCGSHGVMVKTDYCIDEISLSNFDVLILPGGPGYKNLEKCAPLMKKVQSFNEKGKLLA